MIVLGGEISSNYKDNHKPASKHKDDIINAVKVVAGKFTSTQITARAKAANGQMASTD
jgi:hypothetical protein